VHLKSLTLRGFKSFASATTLRFEPGITAVVGPNGSGKSNVVDAIAWVLGEQGAKALRGGKMEDVIFAGTAGRAPLGRAEVTLTIDNADGKLPIEYTEVSITRRMYRDGASEYEINGSSARLLDIQELLSDSGIGREMHVIVGQGQLDSVLSARPEDRRGFIEEAAGVLKHRKRKERALRRLEAMQANLTRLSDLTAELRRQLKPLGRQAEVARRAATVQADLRDAKLRLLADDLASLSLQVSRDVADETAIRARRGDVETSLTAAQERETALDASMAQDAPALARAQETWYRLSALEERLRGTAGLAGERIRLLSAQSVDSTTRPQRDPETMEIEAAQIRGEEAELQAGLDSGREALGEAVELRQQIERQLSEAERAVVMAVRAVADRREGVARLAGQVNALRARSTTAEQEMERLSGAAAEARSRAAEAQQQLGALQDQVGDLDEGELGLDERHEAAVAQHDSAVAALQELIDARRLAEQDRSTSAARRDALALGLARKDGAGSLLGAGSRLPGLLGSMAALLTVAPGTEQAIAAALGPLADAIAVRGASDALEAMDLLKAESGGRAGVLFPDPGADAAAAPSGIGSAALLPSGCRWARGAVTVPAQLDAVVATALSGVALVPDLAVARALVDAGTVRLAVTPDGDVLGAGWLAGGSPSQPSALEIQIEVDQAQAAVEEAAERLGAAAGAIEAATARRDAAAEEVEIALGALHASDANLAAIAEQLGQLGQAARSAAADAQRMEQDRADAQQARDRDLAGLRELEQRLENAEVEPEDHEPSTDARDALQQQLGAIRQREMDARLAVRTGEERVRAMSGRAESLLGAARLERAARIREQEATQARIRGESLARDVQGAAQEALGAIGRSIALALEQRDEAQRVRAVREGELLTLRAATRELGEELERLTSAVHRDEVLRTEQRLRIEALQVRAADEFGIEAQSLAGEYGPSAPVPPTAGEVAEYELARERGEPVVAPVPGPYVRGDQERRAARGERDLALLGKVNPLALEEFAALEERHQFLSTQLEDLKATRRDLLTVVREVDDRILEVFTAAYHDVAREFEIVFQTLFPGGEGRLVLTDPDDMLLTGIEVEARPPGKKIKRLSLLSGGERSLTAVALLVAIFRARPSPFYVLDEVEAALDDVNLGRLVSLIEELRSSSQLIIITHQKRTMEVADALYGVTMRGDGITQVISQRLRSDVEA
jgi:chromosome segregation protein